MVAFVFQTRNLRANYCYTSITIMIITLVWENHIRHYQEDISGLALLRMSANILPPALNVFAISPITKFRLVFCILCQYLMNDLLTLQWISLALFPNQMDMT